MRPYKVTVLKEIYCRNEASAEWIKEVVLQQMEAEALDLREIIAAGGDRRVTALKGHVMAEPISDDLPMA